MKDENNRRIFGADDTKEELNPRQQVGCDRRLLLMQIPEGHADYAIPKKQQISRGSFDHPLNSECK